MERIASFSVDHRVLEPGVYVSRRDVDEKTGAVVTTFDLRLTAPNREPVMDTAAVHALEHLGATFLRNDPAWSSRIIYFGPMGFTLWYLVRRSRWTWRICSYVFLSLPVITRVRFPVHVLKNAEIGMMPTLCRHSGGHVGIWRKRCIVSMTPICIIRRC